MCAPADTSSKRPPWRYGKAPSYATPPDVVPLTKPGPSPVPRTPSKSSDKELEAPEAFTPALEVRVRACMVFLPAGACISTGAFAEVDSMLQTVRCLSAQATAVCHAADRASHVLALIKKCTCCSTGHGLRCSDLPLVDILVVSSASVLMSIVSCTLHAWTLGLKEGCCIFVHAAQLATLQEQPAGSPLEAPVATPPATPLHELPQTSIEDQNSHHLLLSGRQAEPATPLNPALPAADSLPEPRGELLNLRNPILC